MKVEMLVVPKLRALIGAIVLSALLLVTLAVSLHITVQTSAQAKVVATNTAPPGNTLRVQYGEPATLDPAAASYTSEILVIRQVFEGLVRLDENLNPQPALASAWSYSPDASVYTFTLREAYFANGRRVVATDVVTSIMRALSPTIGAGYALVLYDIQGAQEYNQGNISATVGVQALDLTTVRFNLVGTVPPALFLKKLSLWIASVVPIEEVNAGGAQWWRNPVRLVGTGPFKMTEWVPGDHISLAPNPLHYAGPPPLSGITVRFINDTNTAWNEYRANQLDVFGPSTSQVVTITADPILSKEFITSAGIGTMYSIMDNQMAPFTGTSGLKLRQAFSYAIDKTLLISATLSNIGMPAKGLIPPSVYGYNPVLQGLDFNVVSATQCLTESGYAGTPQVLFYTRAGGDARVSNIIAQLSDNLGVNVVTTTASVYQMRLWGWYADYPDPENWLPILLRSNAGFNRTHYNNPTFDALVDQAAHTITESERLGLYNQAEQLAVSEAALLPLYHNQSMLLQKPWVSGPMAFDLQWGRPFNDIRIASSTSITPGTAVAFTADPNVNLQFPADAVTQSAIITYSAIATLPTGLPDNLIGTGYTFVLTGTYSDGSPLGAFQSPVTLTIQYTLPSFIREDTLTLYTWDGNAWVAADNCGGPWIDTNSNVFQVALCRLGEYALVGQTYRIYLPVMLKNH